MRGSNDGTAINGSVELAGSVCRTGHAWFRASADGRSFSLCCARLKGDEIIVVVRLALHASLTALPPTVQLELILTTRLAASHHRFTAAI